jgi:mono/diheme cytochrome c family protein
MYHNCLKYCLLLVFGLTIIVGRSHAASSVAEGKALFQSQCKTCHNANMKDDMTGPALGGFDSRWASYPKEDLHNWVRNSQALVAAGHPRALELWNKWKPTVMTPFPAFTDEQIESIFLYINDQFNKAPVNTNVAANNGPGGKPTVDKSNDFIYWILFGVLLLLVFTLARAISNLRAIVAESDGIPVERKSVKQILTSKAVVGFLVFAIVVIGGYTTVNNGIAFGRQQGYSPDQPIKFSHATHAGVQKIDCQYCHDGARRSKHASIPAASTCMNCHKAIKKGSKFGTQELTKIFASIGYDPSTDKYIENYDKLSNDDIKAIYTKWIGESYLKEKNLPTLDRRGIRTVNEQWDEISSSMTNELKDKISGPIEWTRVHMLPDYVYFNHSQHVTIGKLNCQQCHGKVQEMDLMYQYAPLSMGWCVNCHRQTAVQFEGNAYYETFKQYHEALAKGDKSKVTVEDIGGLECQKCHY